MANRFFQNYLKLVDKDAKLFFYSNATMEWLILRVEALQNLTLFTAVFLLVLLPKGYVDPGLVGLSLSYALALTSTQVFMIRWYSSLANYIISVERIKQFMHIPPEPPAIVEDGRPPSSWPCEGRIKLQDQRVCLRWVYERGVSILVKSFNKEWIKENLDIFDWMLSPKESKKIDQIPRKKGCLGIKFISDQGPYKSVEELWDANI
ncbi:ABC transporter C family member 8 [Camellia lanceoleosa]|uniref:ABC transporter C family member 8 n=1 Tax=Camellia lanceoleosa TaxID=1840588 RepID=A0ACC0IR05_9ERIC|nr:ABC transporter C family member 8 [Camellia lanceoleosa]